MKGFHSPEEEGSWEITHEEIKNESEQLKKELEQKKKEEEFLSEFKEFLYESIEPEPTKGNATNAKGWRTVNPLSD